MTEEEMEAKRTPAGGFTRKQLAEWGVPWPPPKGWRKALLGRPPGEIIPDTLQGLIESVLTVNSATDNREFALFYFDDLDDPVWRADFGNPTNCVMLGEAEGQFRGEGKTAVDAVRDLIRNIAEGKRHD